ncbi:MAG: SH3 domain-containing protein [Chloroflexota bacterium]
MTAQSTAAPLVRQARVVNTNGDGALVRREPSVNAPSSGLVREDGVVQLLGPEETVQAQVWRQVEDAQGNQGWIRADYLAIIEPATPLPLAPPP